MKTATKWKTQSGTDTVESQSSFSLLLENGFKLLLEDGGDLLLENSVVTPKAPTQWIITDKIRTSWEARDGSSTAVLGVEETRITAQGDRRITAQGDVRVTAPTTFTKKNPTAWSEL
jgi:hypothetical protein